MESTLNMPDTNLRIPFLETADIGKDMDLGHNWFKATSAINDNKLKNFSPVYRQLRTEITEKEFIFLNTSFTDMNLLVKCLNEEMKNILFVVEEKVKKLKTRLKQLQEFYPKIVASSENSISVKAVETIDEILAIQHEINNLQNHKRYNILSDRLARASTLIGDKLNEHEIVHLVELGLIEEIKYSFNDIFTNYRSILSEKDIHQKAYCYSPLGLAFMEAWQER